MDQGLDIEIRGEKLRLLPEKAIYWPRAQTLLVADLHWGKTEVFQKQGVAIPAGILEADLGRLSRILAETGARRLVVLGDILHRPETLTEATIESVAVWRQSFAGEVIFIRGNHDRNWKEAPQEWRIDRFVDEWREEPFTFRHDPEGGVEGFSFCGHEHPMLALGGRADRLRLPCFHFTQRWAVLPAFSEFTRGRNISPARGDQVFVVAPNRVVPLDAANE